MEPVWDVLAYVVLPLWVVCGFLDYLCHRASHMENATGARESLLHWLMLLEVMLPLFLAVFFRINALVLALMLLCLAAHEITGYYDLKLAMATRKVTAFEHQVHSALEILPLTAMLLIMTLHWPQTLALFGLGSRHADFSLGPKQMPRWGELVPPQRRLYRSCDPTLYGRTVAGSSRETGDPKRKSRKVIPSGLFL
jgi:hypothetical protein